MSRLKIYHNSVLIFDYFIKYEIKHFLKTFKICCFNYNIVITTNNIPIYYYIMLLEYFYSYKILWNYTKGFFNILIKSNFLFYVLDYFLLFNFACFKNYYYYYELFFFTNAKNFTLKNWLQVFEICCPLMINYSILNDLKYLKKI
uniref:hypothetical protein n=1 Tax=Pulvinaster venetus TaxID=427767 RepID=UPI001FCD3B6E|nr:hypothetical protein MW436_mgp17 [Pulvinaster venetus]UNJ18965.1 hypothetical protein [Pulvinaster venetus]